MQTCLMAICLLDLKQFHVQMFFVIYIEKFSIEIIEKLSGQKRCSEGRLS